jgi:hypothetical protein
MQFEAHIDYLKKTIKDFKITTKGKTRFTCPNLQNHVYKSDIPTAEFSTNEKICCYVCGIKLSQVECVRLLEPSKATFTDDEIQSYISGDNNITIPEFETYKNYGWSLTKETRNGRNPFIGDWQNTTNYEPKDWKKWVDLGYNVGLMTGEHSKVTGIDFDLYKIKEHTPDTKKLLELLESAQTLMQRTRSGGRHYFFQYDADFKNEVKFTQGLSMEVKNTGGALTLQPSKIDGKCYEFINLGAEIKPIPKELKEFLLNYKPSKPEVKTLEQSEIEKLPGVVTFGDGDGRNNLITSIGGLLINRLTPDDTEFVMSVINTKFFNPRLSPGELKASCNSLTGYKKTEEMSQGERVFEYLKEMKEVSPLDTKDSLQLSRAVVDKWLSIFVKKDKAIRLGKGRGVRYQYKEKIEWADSFEKEVSVPVPYTIPYFGHIHRFVLGDLILLGMRRGKGKTTCAVNIIKDVVGQGIKPYYLSSESGSRFGDIALRLGLKPGDFFYPPKNSDQEVFNPMTLELVPNSFTILDWLDIQDYSEVGIMMKHLNDSLKKANGTLIVFTQLKAEDGGWFAPNLIDHVCSFSARHFPDGDGDGHWLIDKAREATVDIGDYFTVPTRFDRKTLELKLRDV